MQAYKLSGLVMENELFILIATTHPVHLASLKNVQLIARRLRNRSYDRSIRMCLYYVCQVRPPAEVIV
jgi:hypothetical protein